MGWFDKKSWQLRRKIRDLQAELAVAEREGKYVVEQGLFFAELREMADATIMVLGTADHLDSEEDTIIRNFFDRNGFTVEALRLDRNQKSLAAVEIIPPEELTRRVARVLKEGDYRLIDDSDQERRSNLEKQTLTLSDLIRAISALFAAHVHQLIISTPLKMNMEGNRLLHWTPLIREALLKKVSPDVVAVCRESFINAYNHYYGRFGEMANPEQFQNFTDEASTEEPLRPESGNSPDMSETEKSDTAPWASSSETERFPGKLSRDAKQSLFASTSPAQSIQKDRNAEAAYVLAGMYKSLIGTTEKRRVRNAEILLEKISQFFAATAVCVLSKNDSDAPFKLQANSGKTLCVETSEDGTVKCDTEFLHKALISHTITVLAPSENGNTHPKAVVVPLEIDDVPATVLYIVEPTMYDVAVNSSDSHHATLFAQVFREFPDLVLPGILAQKN